MFYISKGPKQSELLEIYQNVYDDMTEVGGFDREDIERLARLIGFVIGDGTKLPEEEKDRWLETGILEMRDSKGKEYEDPRLVLPWIDTEESEIEHDKKGWLNNHDAYLALGLFDDYIRYHINSEAEIIWTATPKGKAKYGGRDNSSAN